MKSNFLIGNFMPGYVSSIRFNRDVRPNQFIDADELPSRFARRSERGRARRAQYQTGIRAGLVAALLITIGAFSIPFQSAGPQIEMVASAQEVVQMEEIQQTLQQQTPPPPPRPAFLAVVPDDAVLDDVSLDLDASLELDDPIAEAGPPPADVMEEEEEHDENEIFVVVEQLPQLVGGNESLYAALAYPEMARKAGLEGRVVVQVVVNADGTPSAPEVLRSAGDVLDSAAVDAVMQQQFRPGMQRNRPVRTRVALQVNFQLSQS